MMTLPANPKTDESTAAQREALARAGAAAAAGNPLGMLEALHESRFLDGLVRYLESQWRMLSPEEVQDTIADAVADLQAKVGTGGTVANLSPYLYRSVRNRAFVIHERRKVVAPSAPAVLEEASEYVTSRAWRGPDHLDASGLDHLDATKLAVAAARRLLPQLGHANIQQVMGLILDALDSGMEDISNQQIAETTGLQPATVRQLRSRGFRRLERIAKEDGLIRQDFELLTAAADDADETDGED